jgi:hypothetical protein
VEPLNFINHIIFIKADPLWPYGEFETWIIMLCDSSYTIWHFIMYFLYSYTDGDGKSSRNMLLINNIWWNIFYTCAFIGLLHKSEAGMQPSHWFDNNRQVNMAGHKWLWIKVPTFYSNKIFKLVQRCDKHISVFGCLVEKWRYISGINELHVTL